MRINKRIWVSTILLLVILVFTAQCTKRKSLAIDQDRSRQLMSELGQFYANGDSLKMVETRHKI
jgi:hypothetical protein